MTRRSETDPRISEAPDRASVGDAKHKADETDETDERDEGGSEAGSGANAWHRLATEARHSASLNLDQMSSEEVVALMLDEERRGLELARLHAGKIALAADWLAETLSLGRDALFLGAGTSGRLGILEAAECPPTFGTDPQRIRAAMAGGQEAVFAAREGAEDRAEDGQEAVATLVAGDLLIGISASSVTPFVAGGLARARERGVRSVLVTCAVAPDPSPADLVLALDTGPEILTGSTRLKAGSATKAVLNAITTTAMVRTGKVFENLMVDLRPGSAKLQDRAVRIVSVGGGITRAEAESLLAASQGEVKTAIVAARCGLSVEQSRRLLDRAEGHVRRALESA